MKKIILFLFLIGLSNLFAQSINFRVFHKLDEPKVFNSSDTLKILAVLVEFKEDNDPNTFGNGKFGSIYSKNYGDTILDPYPHDIKYFENHLEFAKNYFKKVSNGKLNIAYTVLPKVITVSQIMRNYSPPPSNPDDLSNLAKFAKEVWHLADSIYTDFDFSKYNLFTIFHAGVGNAYYPNGRLGIERDLPSVYLSESSLKSIFGNNFDGFKTKSYSIKNTIILPTTESKEIDSFGEKILYQMSINGLIVGNIASYLGLPDLFNTETGVTAIDRFGLMDGNALFAFNGTFPPEPSAWEKIFLGWIQPVVIDKIDKKINIVARLAAQMNDTIVVKVPINSSEYYLIENRQRDVKKDGVTVTYKIGNSTHTFHVDKDKPRFNFGNADTLAGVITDVDEFDWAVPGNGIVIWHIDENIIKEKITINKINADIKNRGIDVEEADGIQDIGEHFTSVLGDFYGIGSQEDFWFQGNKAKLYKNKFGPDTKPDTKSNSGANSLITIENFSPSDNKMSFEIKFGENFIKPVSSNFYNFINPQMISIPSDNHNSYYILDNNNLLIINQDNFKIKSYSNFSDKYIASANYNGADYIFGAIGNKVNYLIHNSFEEVLGSIDVSFRITSPIVISNESNKLIAYAGAEGGYLIKINLETLNNVNEAKYEISKIADENIIQICKPFNSSKNYFSVITTTSFYDSDNFKLILPHKPLRAALLYDDQTSDFINVVLSEGNFFYVIEKGEIIKEFEINSENHINSFSLFSDIESGENKIILTNGRKLEAYNFNGILLDNFPIIEASGGNFISVPLTADLNGDRVIDILAATDKGNLYAYDSRSGKILEYFPITIGTEITLAPAIYNYLPESMSPVSQLALMMIDKNNYLHQWIVGINSSNASWVSEFSNSMNNSSIAYSKISNNDKRFFPEEKVYNWPNPVYNEETFIRFFVSENSVVKIKIFDLAGELVDELSGYANGGFDNEIKWNAKNVKSGVYFANVEVKSESGKTASKVIKIAVIK